MRQTREATLAEKLSPVTAPLLRPAIAGVFAIALAERWPAMWWLGGLIALGCFFRSRSLTWALAMLVALFLGSQHGHQVGAQEAWREAVPAGERVHVVVSGVVVGQPQSRGESTRYFLRVDEAPEGWVTGVKLSAVWRGRPVFHGERIRLSCMVEQPVGATNPGEFDRPKMLWRKGVPVVASRTVSLKREGMVWWRWAIRVTHSWRDVVEGYITSGLVSGGVGETVIKAISLGERPSADDATLRSFRDAGVLHIFAVSGLHVGLVVALFGLAFRLVGLSWRRAAMFLIPLVLSYAALTGLPPAAVRAALMAVVLLLGVVLRQRSVFFNGMALSALLVLGADSHQLFGMGFQLSYGVLAVIVCGTGPLLQRLSPWVELDPFLPKTLYTPVQRFGVHARRYVAALSASSLVAWLGSIPLAGLYFRMFTPVSVVTSILLAGPVMAVMALSIVSFLVGALWPWGGERVVAVNDYAGRSCAAIVRSTNRIPLGSWDMRQAFARKGRIVIFHLRNGGDAVAVNEGGGLLIDSGSERNYSAVLIDGLRHAGVRAETLILSHPAGDAAGGAAAEIARGDVRSLWTPTEAARSPAFQKAMSVARDHDVSSERPVAGHWYQVSPDCRWRVVNRPWEKDGYVLADDWTMVVQLEVKGWRVLFLGDAGQDAEKMLLTAECDIRSHVLVVGKSRVSEVGSPELLERISPEVAILSHQPFPAEFSVSNRLLENLVEVGCIPLLQSEHGAVTLSCEEDELVVKSFLGEEGSLITLKSRD